MSTLAQKVLELESKRTQLNSLLGAARTPGGADAHAYARLREEVSALEGQVRALAVDAMKAAPPPPPTGAETKKLLDQAPAMMAELTRQFIDNKDLNERVKIRLRMKSLIDLASVDTAYPPVPALDPRRGDPMGYRGEIERGVGGGGFGQYLQPGHDVAIGGVGVHAPIAPPALPPLPPAPPVPAVVEPIPGAAVAAP